MLFLREDELGLAFTSAVDIEQQWMSEKYLMKHSLDVVGVSLKRGAQCCDAASKPREAVSVGSKPVRPTPEGN